MLKYSILPC